MNDETTEQEERLLGLVEAYGVARLERDQAKTRYIQANKREPECPAAKLAKQNQLTWANKVTVLNNQIMALILEMTDPIKEWA